MSSKIRTCTREDSGVLTETIRISFRDVAERFGLTPESAPRHPSNCSEDWIRKDLDRGVTYFMIEHEGSPIGCVALEKADSDVCYLERLAVLPGQRGCGFGKALVAHVMENARLLGAHRVDIGIIADHAELKNWYQRIGFIEGESRVFPHLPFRVTFMSYDLDKDCPKITSG
ncbi:MAG TPA: GNAT family N-acetyltransferase [Deltaproteobacteria bacterium]|nr:GNAT family N-acetyltransferase [Deltaproteobacteria bacterium]HQJ09351.1 GNAT family N-acetyltransferase [Deltaproteobacteria bacterium]